jgi:hypothetical protein
MTILEIIKAVKIDFTQGVITCDCASELDFDFEISPKDFLGFSKTDFKLKDKRGNINALTNAKRAIDCQTDKIFSALGLDTNNFPPIIEEFINISKNSPEEKDLPIRLRFLQSVNFAPALIIANTRTLRNKLEHFYKEPTNKELSDAIQLAELFISATDNKLKRLWDFSISDKEKKPEYEKSIYIDYDYKKNLFKLRGYLNKGETKQIEILNTKLEFYFILKIVTSFDYPEDVKDAFVDFIEFIEHPIPVKNINITTE